MKSEEITYHVENYLYNAWKKAYSCDTLELARERKEEEQLYFGNVRIMKETRVVTLEEVE